MRREIVSAVAAGALVTSVLTGCSLEKVARQVPGGREAVPTAAPLPELPKQLDLSPTNRRAPVDGLPDWSKAGYREGTGLPTDGNGYLRGSRVWDSVYAGYHLRHLRHFTFQWSASGNVFVGNDTDADVNLHGGWERHNLVERNVVRVPYEHRPGNCSKNCGGEGGEGGSDDSVWYPIWWGAGKKAVKWSGASGPQNVFFANRMAKQEKKNGPYVAYFPDRHTVYQFGWDGHGYRHLTADGEPIEDWAGHERDDFTGAGVDTGRTDDHASLFLRT